METEDRSGKPADPTTTVAFQPLARSEGDEFPDFPHRMEVEVVGGPMDGLRRGVSGVSLSMGRSEENDIHLLHDETISSRHAKIVREGEHYWLEDLQSRNGTFLGDEKIQKRTLIGPGTIFTVGVTSIEFMPR